MKDNALKQYLLKYIEWEKAYCKKYIAAKEYDKVFLSWGYIQCYSDMLYTLLDTDISRTDDEYMEIARHVSDIACLFREKAG